MKKKYALMILFLLGCATVFAAPAEKKIQDSFKVKPGGLLTIEADMGSIEVKTGKTNEVNVEVLFEKRSGSTGRFDSIVEDFKVEMNQVKDDVNVILEYPERLRTSFWDSAGRYVRVRFIVKVPEKYNVNLQTAGGSISVDDLTGEVVTATSGGSLKFGAIKGAVNGKTSGGSIALTECEGDVSVRTSGGSISIGKVKGTVDAHTSGGSIRVDEVFGDINAGTSGGSVTAQISRQPENKCVLKTSGGTITVYLASDIKVDLDARTSGGRVHTDFPITIQGKIDSRVLQAEINGGGPELNLRTSGGSIYIKEYNNK